jgi:glycine cleavage system T protein
MAKVEDFLFQETAAEVDPDITRLIELEEERQARKIIMIASESICPAPVRWALSSVFNNIYAEGYPSPRMTEFERELIMDFPHMVTHHRRYSDRRYYKGTEYCDYVEALAQRRVCELFATEKIPAKMIYANVQSLSGAAANNAVYDAFVKPGEIVMGLSLTHGGHLTHGNPANRSGRHYRVVSYEVSPATGKLDYDRIADAALKYRPRMIIAGYSAYPWAPDWAKFREIADKVGAVLLADIAHTAGLVVALQHPNPIEHAHVITFTTHKTLCGPRGACILTADPECAQKIMAAVFPGEQGGPHIHQIAAKAVCFKIAKTEKFRALMEQVVCNAKHLALSLEKIELPVAYGGTDTHMCLIDLRKIKTPTGVTLTGEIASRILDICGITVNKNTIPQDIYPAHPGAVRFGTTWVSQRGMGEPEMEKIADLTHRVLTNIHNFNYLEVNGPVGRGKIDIGIIREVRKEVEELESRFPREVEIGDTGYPHFYRNESVLASPLKRHKAADTKWSERALQNAVMIDCSGCAVLVVSGARALQFIQGVASANFSNLGVGATKPTFLLDSKGRVIADAIVHRMEKDDRGRDRFLLIPTAANSERVTEWLRFVSDGYVIFDEEDILAKIEGPVVVEDLRTAAEPSERRIAVLVCGKKAQEVIAKSGVERPESDDAKVIGCAAKDAKLFYILVKQSKAAEIWSSITQSGAEPVDSEVLPLLRKELGLPNYSDGSPLASSIYSDGFRDWFGENKFYFAGMKPLREILKRPERRKEEFHWKEKEPSELKKTALFEEHAKLTKKDFLIPFAGWHMPVWYSRVSEEHSAVRTAAGLFDVSHMGLFEVKGEYATRFLDIVLSNYVPWFRVGQAFYSYCLGPDGNVIDDTFTYKLGEDWYYIVVNASNTEKMWAWLNGVNEGKYTIDREKPSLEVEGRVTLRDLHSPETGPDRRVNIALQGPNSLTILLRMLNREDEKRRLRVLPWTNTMWADISGTRCLIARTGYTGERIAYEIYVSRDFAPEFWRKTLQAGADLGIKPCGLGARDSTRTEAGLPLYGHELAGPLNISPIEAGYAAFVRFHKPFFIGRKAMIENEKKRTMEIVRFRLLDKNIRALHLGDPVASKRAKHIGYVTSSVLVDEYQVGMAYVDRRMNVPGTRIEAFPAAASGAAPEKQKTTLKIGDSLLISGEGEILARWLVKQV